MWQPALSIKSRLAELHGCTTFLPPGHNTPKVHYKCKFEHDILAKMNAYTAPYLRLHRRSWQILTKVPKITLYFWIIKLLTTAMGESACDYLVKHMNPVLAVGIGFVGLVIALVLQFSAPKYTAWAYWLAVAMVSVFGTMAADVLHIQFHVSYGISSIFYGCVLVAIFVLWLRREGTLSIHSVYTRRREVFYWAAVLTTFALGTATGDLTAISLHLGYFSSGLLFFAIFALPALGYWLFRLNAIFAFWFAYIVTRPLGASFADWIGKPKFVGGLGAGDGAVALGLTVLIVFFVGYMQFSGRDQSAHGADNVSAA